MKNRTYPQAARLRLHAHRAAVAAEREAAFAAVAAERTAAVAAESVGKSFNKSKSKSNE